MINSVSLLLGCAVLLSLHLSFVTSTSGHDHGEYGHTCTICNCFIKYENRDILVPRDPYYEVIYPTLDECLGWCWTDRQKTGRCKSVIYGIVGGNAGIICEFYNASGIPNNLYYQWAVDYFEPALNWPCYEAVPDTRYLNIQTPEVGRAKFRKEFAFRPNPNYGQNFQFDQFPQLLLPQDSQQPVGNPPAYNSAPSTSYTAAKLSAARLRRRIRANRRRDLHTK